MERRGEEGGGDRTNLVSLQETEAHMKYRTPPQLPDVVSVGLWDVGGQSDASSAKTTVLALCLSFLVTS